MRFHLENEVFEFYQPVKMRDDPLWIDVTDLMLRGNDGLGKIITQFAPENIPTYIGRLSRLLAITDIDIHSEEVTGKDKTLDVVVDIFNRVNSGGTKLSRGDLTLAKICADWPQARDAMKGHLRRWADQGFNFSMDGLLRSVNTVLTGEAKFQFLHDCDAISVHDGVKRAAKHIDTCLNMISRRLGLDHEQVLFGRFDIPIMVYYQDKKRVSRVLCNQLFYFSSLTLSS